MNEKLTNQKDNLARLMAGEDLTVIHKRIPTAYFDIKNRVLACPIFKEDMSPELYDLFMGHEVGHALNTPYEGLHSALENNRTLKGYLNVIEDVRIEKAIKAKYPGLVKSFFAAYKELVAQDFFGIKGKNVNALSLIDKINLQTKVGSSAGVIFTDEELPFYEMSEACTTWEEVVECATAIYEWSKENETRNEDDQRAAVTMPEAGDDSSDEDEDWDEDDFMEPDFDPNTSESDDDDGLPDDDDSSQLGNESSDSGEDSDDAQEGEGDGEDGEEEEGGQGDIASKTGGTSSNKNPSNYSDDENGARESITEYNAHQNEGSFVESAPIVRTTKNISKMFENGGEIDSMIVTAEKLSVDLNEWFSENDDSENLIKYADFSAKKIVDKNKSLINHMAKEFEMKQNAMRSVKAFQGKTGKLDMNAVAKYQVMDDIFKRVTYLPDGKNHGVVVLLDWSGSIYGSIKNLLEQSLILAEFCRKVNIPFRVYAFSDQYRGDSDFGRDNVLLELFANGKKKQTQRDMIRLFGLLYNAYITADTRSWSKSEDTIKDWFDGAPFEFSIWNMIRLDSPQKLRLGGTPLNNSLLAMRKILPAFRNAYQLEKMILTVITDGFSHDSTHLKLTREESSEAYEQENEIRTTEDLGWNQIAKHIFITDPYSRKTYPYSVPKGDGYNYRGNSNDWERTANLLDWLSKETGVTVTGYFALERKQDFYDILNSCGSLSQSIEKDYGYDDNYRKTWGKIRKEGYVVKAHGYGKLFICCSANLKTVDDELSDDLIGAKKSTLLSNFKKNRSSKVGSRFLTNEFIKEIA